MARPIFVFSVSSCSTSYPARRRRSGTVAVGFGLVVVPRGNESWVGQRDSHPCRRAHNAGCCSYTMANMRKWNFPRTQLQFPGGWALVHGSLVIQELARRPGAAPGTSGFGDRIARLARGVFVQRTGWPTRPSSAWMTRVISRRRAASPPNGASNAPGRLPGQPGRIRAPDHFSAGAGTPLHKVEIERGRQHHAPGPDMDKQRTNTVAGRYRCGHRCFAVDVSVFGAHLLRSPSSM